ncbi:MAG: DUF4384 domain-containing protein [Gemmataceae bacterium]
MLPPDDLTSWGEKPATSREQELADLIADLMEAGEDLSMTRMRVVSDTEAARLVEVCGWIEDMMDTLAEQSGVLVNFAPQAAPGAEVRPVQLNMSVGRLRRGECIPVAAHKPAPCIVRDIKRVPDDTNRVVLHTGDRVRIEVVSDQAGFIVVFNRGPAGAIHLLYPARIDEVARIHAGVPVQIDNIEMAPPAGRERVYAIWSRAPLARPGHQLRDMKRVEDAVSQLRPDDWHAILIELDHHAA